MKQILIPFLLLFLLTTSCSWSDSLFGGSGSDSTNNNSTNLPPTTPLTVNISKGTATGPCAIDQPDYTIEPTICFEVEFNRAPQSISSADVAVVQPNSSAIVTVNPSGDPLKFSVNIQNYNLDGSDDGIYSIDIPANTLTDAFGNQNTTASFSDNTVEVTQMAVRTPFIIPASGGSLVSDSCQGLNLDTWQQTGVTSLNTFFAGSPGITPPSIFNSGVVDNLLNADHLQFRPRTDNYVMRWRGFLEITTGGVYVFRTRSDAGSRLYINDILIVNNDGVHSARTKTSSNVILFSGLHTIELQYFDTTAGEEVTTTYSGPDTSTVHISPLSTSFQPITCPHTNALDTSTILSSWTGTAPYNAGLVGLVKNNVQRKHIKVSIDAADLLKINSGHLLNGTENLTGTDSKFLAAHNSAGLTLSTDIGPVSTGPSWTKISRNWRLECTTNSDVITIQIPSSSLDSSVDGIIFSSNDLFTANVRSYLLTNIGAQKATSIRCSDLSSSTQFFSFGRYNL